MASNSAPLMTSPSMPELPGDRGRGDRVIAGDHPDPDAGRPGCRDRGLGGGPRRVDDSHQGEHLQIGDQREQVGGRVEGRRVEVLASGGQHAQALLARAAGSRSCTARGMLRWPAGRAAVGVADGAGAGQQLVGSAFHVTPDHFFPGAVSSCGGTWPSACRRRRTAARRPAGTPACVDAASTPPLAARATSAPSVGSPISSPV